MILDLIIYLNVYTCGDKDENSQHKCQQELKNSFPLNQFCGFILDRCNFFGCKQKLPGPVHQSSLLRIGIRFSFSSSGFGKKRSESKRIRKYWVKLTRSRIAGHAVLPQADDLGDCEEHAAQTLVPSHHMPLVT